MNPRQLPRPIPGIPVPFNTEFRLFVDDHLVSWLHGVTRSLHPGRMLREPAIVEGHT